MSKGLDTIEVTVEHDGEVLTLDVEITAWATKGGHEDPPEGAHWRAAKGVPDALKAVLFFDAINDQVQDYCAERAEPGREG